MLRFQNTFAMARKLDFKRIEVENYRYRGNEHASHLAIKSSSRRSQNQHYLYLKSNGRLHFHLKYKKMKTLLDRITNHMNLIIKKAKKEKYLFLFGGPYCPRLCPCLSSGSGISCGISHLGEVKAHSHWNTTTAKTRWKKSTQFRRICLFTLDSTQEIYIPSDGQESSHQTHRHIFAPEVKMVAILTDLNWQ